MDQTPLATPTDTDLPPTLTVVIPMRNEEAMIEACLASVQASVLPPGTTVEFLVFDGMSSDRSRELVGAISAADPRVRLLDNPARLQSAAFNLAVGMARGSYFIRLDAHSTYADDYLAVCVRLLDETGAGNVGGVQRATGTSLLGHAIAAAVSSRFAAGDAHYRHATTARWTDTVYLGAWRTATLRELGGMREDLAVNEDYEMNVRLRQRGGRIYLSPELRSVYYVRDSLSRLSRQYLRYGFWKARTILEHPASLRWRQLVAPAFVLSIVLTPWLIGLLGPIGAAHLGLYVVASLAAAVLAAGGRSLAILPLLPAIFLTLHLSWGVGFLAGMVYWPFRRGR